MNVGIAYGGTEDQVWLRLEVPEGSTVQDAIDLSGVLTRFPEIDLNKHKVGIYGKVVKLGTPLKDSDRIEIYRAITADPDKVPKRNFDDDEDDE